MQPLASKEQSLFRQLVKLYEGKHYKKGIKTADQILRVSPNHGETQAMKALILNSSGQQEEAFALAKIALKNDMKSHVCWHVYGLLWRSVKNYDEAIKAYKFALKLDPEQLNILRDLALLQMQMRDYKGYIDARRILLTKKSTLRQNWTAVAVGHHLLGNYQTAENILQKYEETITGPTGKYDIEHSEAQLYKNTIIAESGDIERALKHLEEISKFNLDKTAVMELRAEYLLKLDRKGEAETAYRALIDRNNEHRAYYEGLETTLQLDRSNPADHNKLKELYDSHAAKNDRLDAARRIPLDFLKGDAFRAAVDPYLRRMLNKGVPSTFPNIKALYNDPEKKAIVEELALGYASEKNANGSAESQTNGDNTPRFEQSVLYFLAQHYDYHLSRDLSKASGYITKLQELNPKSVDYRQLEARILKHSGSLRKAADTMNEARLRDEKDRYINTKCAKYQLRNNQNELALQTMSKFTRNEATGGPLGDLHDMQCMWYLTEDGEAYARQKDLGLALKRFTAVADIFDIWHEDQFDFHSFSLRKGQIRAYIDMIRWEDHIRDHPFFTRAAISAVEIYLILATQQELLSADGNSDASQEIVKDRKQAEQRAKKALEKLRKEEEERKAAAAKKGAPKKVDDDDVKKEDLDPLGIKLTETKEPLEASLRFLTPLLEFSPKNIKAQNIGFEVHFRRRKYLQALKCLNAAHALDPENPKVHEQAVRFRKAMDESSDLPSKTSEAIKSAFTIIPSGVDLTTYNTEFLKKHADSAFHQQCVLNVRFILDPSTKAQNEKDLQATLDLPSVTKEQALLGIDLLDSWKSDEKTKDTYRAAANKKWAEATIFEKNEKK